VETKPSGFPGCGSDFDEAFFQHLLVAEPEVGDVGGAQAEYVFEGATDFVQSEVHADALEEVDQRASAFGKRRLWLSNVASRTLIEWWNKSVIEAALWPFVDVMMIEAPIKTMISDDVNGAGATAVTDDV
jgi:hypothetical protein